MSKPIKKIFLILILIILIPILFFTANEVINQTENEKVIREIYDSQLESLLFSVNQYSEDIVRSWIATINTLNLPLTKKKNTSYQKLNDFFAEHKSVEFLFFSDSLSTESSLYKNGSVEFNSSRVASFINTNRNRIDKLFKFRQKNYVKIEPVTSDEFPDRQLLIFVNNEGILGGIGVNPVAFIQDNLGSKIQSVSRQEFSITVYDSTNSKYIYARAPIQHMQDLSKSLWLFPSYSLGISFIEKSIQDLVEEKTYTNLILISILALLMFAIAFYGYRNIRREVELAQIKSDFVSNVSHELRTPLSLISMFTETLSMGRVKNEEKRDEYYRIIQQETERLSKIVNKILSFSKIEAGKWNYNFSETELNGLIEKIHNTYLFHLEQNGFNFLFEPFHQELFSQIDSESVSEAVINLIDNAAKYSVENKKIILRTGIDKDFVFIEIEDSGIGISESDQKKIFDKFFRITEGNVHNTKGTGLGLTLVKHIVEANKGQIELKSTLGKGSIFRLSFPAVIKKL